MAQIPDRSNQNPAGDSALYAMNPTSARSTPMDSQDENRQEELKLKLAIVVKKYNELVEKARDLNEQLASEQQHSSNLQRQLNDLEDKYVYSQEVVNTVQVDLDTSEKELRLVRDDNASLKEQVDDLNRRLFENEQDGISKEELKIKNRELEMENRRLQEEQRQAQADHQQEIRRLNTERELLMKGKQTADQENALLRAQLGMSQQEMSTFHKNMVKDSRAMMVGLATLRERVKYVDTMITTANRELDKCTSSLYEVMATTQEDLTSMGTELLHLTRDKAAPAPLPEMSPVEEPAATIPGVQQADSMAAASGGVYLPKDYKGTGGLSSSVLGDLVKDLNRLMEKQ